MALVAMQPDSKNPSVGERILTGTLWIGGWRWTGRLLGFVSTLAIARLLLPEDVGIAATALLVVVFFDTLVELGTDSYLIRLTDPDREDYDTAWTLRLLVIAASSAVIFAIAAPAASFFGEQRLVAVLQLLAAASLLRGFINIGLTMYRKDLRFGPVALAGLAPRVVGVATTVVLAFALRNYWAVVIGDVAMRITELILSYAIHSYRPRWCLRRLGKQWDFCKWLVARNIAIFLQGRGDQVVVARFFGIEQIAFYGMAVRFAELPTRHLMAPMLLPVYAGLAKKQTEPAEFVRAVRQVIGASAAICLPGAALFAALSGEFVDAILGPNWKPAVPLVPPIVFTLAIAVLCDPVASALTLAGRVRLLAVLNWLSAAAVVVLIPLIALANDLELLATSRMLLAGVVLLTAYYWLASELSLSWAALLACVARPVAAAAAMAFVANAAASLSPLPWVSVVIGTGAGLSSYVAVLYGLWRLSGSPDAGEALLIRKLSGVLGRVIPSWAPVAAVRMANDEHGNRSG